MNDNNAKSKPVDRLAPRARSAAVRQNARPLGRGQGELYKNVYLPYREGSPPFRAGRLHIRLRNIVHTVTSSGFSFTISGFSATTTHPDGSEHEVVFSEDFTDEEMVSKECPGKR